MNPGFLVSFEGQDASGKTELSRRIVDILAGKGYDIFLVEEFSDSEVGQFLKRLLTQDKFLRMRENNFSALTETLYVVSDLYYQDELEIRIALHAGKIVLKERHIDTVFTCQIPKIIDNYPEHTQAELYKWLKILLEHLYVPDLTIFLDVSRDVLVERIVGRGETVSKHDLQVFDNRQSLYNLLIEQNRTRITLFNNDKTPEIASEELSNMIIKKANHLSLQ